MATYEVELTLCRTVVVTVEANSIEDAKESALYRSRWLTERGTRSRLKQLCSTAKRVTDAR